jgi:hypothetical protein
LALTLVFFIASPFDFLIVVLAGWPFPGYTSAGDLLPDLVRSLTVPAIRIPDAQWGEVWRALVAAGPIACIGPEPPVYLVSDR